MLEKSATDSGEGLNSSIWQFSGESNNIQVENLNNQNTKKCILYFCFVSFPVQRSNNQTMNKTLITAFVHAC